MNQKIFLAGLSHNSANQDLRQKYALPLGVNDLLVAAKERLGVSELVVISTCNRQEIVIVCEPNSPLYKNSKNATAQISKFWAEIIGQEQCELGELNQQCKPGELDESSESGEPGESGQLNELENCIYCFQGRAAVKHLFKVAASLDSMLPGEPQILGQVKKAYCQAVKQGSTKLILNKLFHKSFYTAKRVRSQTQIAANAVSVGFAALNLLKHSLLKQDVLKQGFPPANFEVFQNKKVLILGAGEMAELSAAYLHEAGVQNIIIANRTLANAQSLAQRFEPYFKACTLAQLAQWLPQVDIILGTATASKPIINKLMLQAAAAKREGTPLFIVDIALPRNVEPCVRGMPGVELYDLDDIQELVATNKQNRQREVEKALPIIEQETDAFMQWLNSLTLKPTIVDLLKQTQGIADEELAKTLKRIGPLSKSTEDALQAMLKAVVKKINHQPITFIKRVQQKHGNASHYVDILRSFFGLDEKNKL